MGDTSQQSSMGEGGFDLSQFYSVFFEEAGENLASFESLLLAINVESPEDEDLNAIFRAAHSIKGGSATFGFTDVAELTHELETLLDKVRKHELSLTPNMVDVLLESGDALKAHLSKHKSGGEGESFDDDSLKASLRRLAAGEELEVSEEKSKIERQLRELELIVGPLDDIKIASNIEEPFCEIPSFGKIEKIAFEEGKSPGKNYVRYKIVTLSSDEELLDLCNFYVTKEQMKMSPWPKAVEMKTTTQAIVTSPQDFGFFDDAPGMAVSNPTSNPVTLSATENKISAGVSASPVSDTGSGRTASKAPVVGNLESQTLRVSVEKVDQLINLVGELVITQAMLTQKMTDLDPVQHQHVLSGVSDLERNTRSLQDAVMSIRMIPMAVVFNRFPRMIRDLANKLGKKVELVTSGEATELDKGLIEKITDPLTHLLRNSVDHGIETPERRKLAGKAETGTVALSAYHQGGSIVIEVRDDGAGLRRDKILSKAKERGLPVHDAMSDQEVWQLIFAPGFSTADQVTDVSGRGVGMDVVKKNIQSLGGSVEIDSAAGKGTRMTVRLPLTLAIMDGMSVAVGNEIYILPLASVVESLQMSGDQIKTIANQGRVVEVRNEYLPVASLSEIFSVPGKDRINSESEGGIMVVVECDGSRTAMLVDELVGQHQVVVKNLESNYKRVPAVSGATILGDGRVALIIDVSGVARRARH
jgi:two-component system chemotaxis sensor kinase CheA